MDRKKIDKWILYVESAFLIVLVVISLLASWDIVGTKVARAFLNVFLVVCVIGILNDIMGFIHKRRAKKRGGLPEDEE